MAEAEITDRLLTMTTESRKRMGMVERALATLSRTFNGVGERAWNPAFAFEGGAAQLQERGGRLGERSNTTAQ